MSRRRRKTKELRIRVIGLLDGDSCDPSYMSNPQGSVRHLSLDELLQSEYNDEYANEDQPLWIQVENANSAQLARIGDHFGLHPLTIEAVQTRHTREKLEIFANYLFLVFHALHGGMKNFPTVAAPDWSDATGPRIVDVEEMSSRWRAPAIDPFHAVGGAARVDPYNVSRDQAEVLASLARERNGVESGAAAAGNMSAAEVMRAAQQTNLEAPEFVHEGSALLSANNLATAKYYGGDVSRIGAEPSPGPMAAPRRHRSTVSMLPSSASSSSFNARAGIGLVASASSSAGAGPEELILPPSATSASSIPNAMPPSLQSLRMFPDQTLAPGSPQSRVDSDEDADGRSVSGNDTDSDDMSSTGWSSSSSDESVESRSTRPSRSISVDVGSRANIQGRRAKGSAADDVIHSLRKGVGNLAVLPVSESGFEEPGENATNVPAISAATAANLLSEREPLRTAPIKLVVFPHIVLSFHSSNLAVVDSVVHRLERVYGSAVESTAWIIHALLDSITDSLLPVVNGTAMEVDALEELIYVLSGSEHRDLLKRMGMTRRRLSFLRHRLWSKRDILMSLIGKDWQMFLAGVQIPYLRDVYDHVVTLLHRVEAASDMLVSLQNTYLANVQIDVAEASNDANTVMKNLTAVGAIILPLQLFAGLMGMNCMVPFQVFLTWDDPVPLVPFLSICTAMVGVTLFMTMYFKKHDLM